MMNLCVKCDGRVLVAQEREAVVGFVTILTKVKSEAIEERALEFGLVSDLVVASGFRGRGIGRELLRAAESFARSSRVRWLRVGVLAENRTANALYDSMGFKEFYIEREKSLLEIAEEAEGKMAIADGFRPNPVRRRD